MDHTKPMEFFQKVALYERRISVRDFTQRLISATKLALNTVKAIQTEALDSDTHAIAVQNNANERTVTSSNAESCAKTHYSARTVTEEKESSS